MEPERWHKGPHCYRYPTSGPISVDDIFRPTERPLITKDTKVLAFGSCFAEYFIRFLDAHGYNQWQLPSEGYAYCQENLFLALPTTFESVFVIEQQVRWAFGHMASDTAFWITRDKTLFEATEERRLKIRQSFLEADVIIITLGLSEIWYDKISGEPLWRLIPESLYDPARHAFRCATVSETLDSLRSLDRLVAEFIPRSRFVLTLSPVPLHSTFRDRPPVVANVASKAILRAALDEFFSDEKIAASGRYLYFPSYEIALNMFGNPFGPDNRHVRPEVATAIMNIFSAACTDMQTAHRDFAQSESQIEILRRRVGALERELDSKEAAIRELDAAARERLEIIHRLTETPQLPARD